MLGNYIVTPEDGCSGDKNFLFVIRENTVEILHPQLLRSFFCLVMYVLLGFLSFCCYVLRVLNYAFCYVRNLFLISKQVQLRNAAGPLRDFSKNTFG